MKNGFPPRRALDPVCCVTRGNIYALKPRLAEKETKKRGLIIKVHRSRNSLFIMLCLGWALGATYLYGDI